MGERERRRWGGGGECQAIVDWVGSRILLEFTIR